MSLTECEPPAPVSVFLSLKNFHSSHEGSRRERKSRSTRRNSLTLPPTIDEEPLSVEDVEAAVLDVRDSCCAVYPDRALCVRRARLVTYLSLAITLVGGGLGLFAARLLNSAAVLGYALESFVDVWSSILVLYRFWDDKTEAEATRHRERLASFGISLTFLGVGLLVGAQALSNLHEQHAPQGGPLLLGLSAISAMALSALCAVKWRLSEQLRSESLRKDAVTSGAVAVLSVAILLSSGLHARNAALWWFDSLVALVVAGVLLASALYALAVERWWCATFWAPRPDPWRQMLALSPGARALLGAGSCAVLG